MVASFSRCRALDPTTAAAIASIAFGEPLAVLDGNVMRVLARLLAWYDDIARPKTRAKLQAAADAWLDPQAPGHHNQAVMELGATICLPRKPRCLLCPLQSFCRGRTAADSLPVKSRIGLTRREETVAVGATRWRDLLRAGAIRRAVAWGSGACHSCTRPRCGPGLHWGQLRYGITRYSVTMRAISAEWVNAEASTLDRTGSYLDPGRIALLPLAAPHRRMLEQIGGGADSRSRFDQRLITHCFPLLSGSTTLSGRGASRAPCSAVLSSKPAKCSTPCRA